MGIFDIFTNTQGTNAAQAPPQQQVNGQPGNIPPPSDPAMAGQGVVPQSAAVAPVAPQVPDSPLDTFKDLWEPVPVDPNSSTPPVSAPLTAEQVQEAVSKANFAGQITPEQMNSISAGGVEAQQAFTEAMNSVAQQVMVQSTMVSNRLTEKAVAEALDKQTASIPQMLRKQASTAHLNDTSEIFSNPAIQPVVQATQAQLLQKFPHATPAEITTMTQDFIQAMGEQFAPKPVANPNDTDWSSFL
jgi:hypothetical protein